MSYQVLARKYRPKSFDTLVGQEHVVRALSHALDQQRLHHAYLFTGTRGVGKTTLSRILAKSFNCETGISAHACGVCDACTAIDAGRFVDYIEMDAASNRGVDEMAQLLEQAVYAPSNARFKVYMIDEVHMLTNHAFNSMLKTLEEPPDHVKFILATTDPQKIPVTVLSRCLQFNLKQMPPGHIVSHLDDILGQEGIGFETPALRLLAQGAHGSMRDALSLTDQAIAYAAGTVTLEAVQGMLGALDQSFLIRLLDALAGKDGAGLLAVADDMATRSLSYNAALQDLATLLHKIALAQTVPAAIAEDMPEREHIVRLAGLFDAEEVQLFYQIAVHGRNELGLAPDEYAGFSMTLLRMLAFRPDAGGSVAKAAPAVASPFATRQHITSPAAAYSAPPAKQAVAAAPPVALASPVMPAPVMTVVTAAETPAAAAPAATRAAVMSPGRAAFEAARNGGKIPAAARAPAAAVAPVAAPMAVPAAKPVSEAAPVMRMPTTVAPAPPWDEEEQPPMVSDDRSMPATAEAQKKTEPSASGDSSDLNYSSDLNDARNSSDARNSGNPSAAAAMPEASAPPALVPIAALDWDGNWPALAAALPVRGVAQQLAQQSELLTAEQGNGGIQMHFRVAMETLLSAGSVDKLSAVLAEHFGHAVRITTEIGAVSHTAHAQATADRAERQREAEQFMHNDPFVNTMMREFDAVIVPGSIKPL
jgi:DNA polymerase-3 subunit gamma/tau